MSLALRNLIVFIVFAFTTFSSGAAKPVAAAGSCQTCLATSKLEELQKQLEHLTNEVKELTKNSKGSACNSSWVLVFENDVKGQQVSGSLQQLINDVRQGASVRVLLWNSAMEADYIHIHHNQVSVQLLQAVNRVNWQSFQTDSQWVWTMVTTNADTQQVRYNVGSSAFKGETLVKAAVKWFTKKTSCSNKPVYSHDKTGKALSGSLSDLMTSVKEGADLRGVSFQGASAFHVQNVALSKTLVSGQTLNPISTSILQNQQAARFQNNAYWWFTMYTTRGTLDMSRWTVGEHISRGHTQDRVDIDWFADPCWKRVYSNGKTGTGTFGSLADLVAAIKKGSRVRVQFSSFYTVEADNLSIRNGHVTAQVLKHVSKQDLVKMQDNAYWFWQMVSTTGTVRSTRYYIGKHQHLSTTTENREVHWYVDTQPWKLVYEHDARGKALHGSEEHVVAAVRSGASMRAYYESSPNQLYAFAFQNLRIEGQHVAGQHLNSVSMTSSPSSQYEMEIQANAYRWFVIFTTQGRMEMIRWSVGAHVARGHNTITMGLKWFANN